MIAEVITVLGDPSTTFKEQERLFSAGKSRITFGSNIIADDTEMQTIYSNPCNNSILY